MKNVKIFSGVAMSLLLLSPISLFAETTSNDILTSIQANSEHQSLPVVTAYNPTCASSAVSAHEDSMQSIREINQASMKTVSTTRRDALKAAYLLSDESSRNTAIKNAYYASMTAEKAASKVMQDSMMKENSLFMTTMKGCGVMRNPMSYQMDGDNKNTLNMNDMKKEVGDNMDKMKIEIPKNIDTAWIQKILMSQGVFSGKVDGRIGPMTKNALKEFQNRHNLKADGVVGPNTFNILKSFDSGDLNMSGKMDSENDKDASEREDN